MFSSIKTFISAKSDHENTENSSQQSENPIEKPNSQQNGYETRSEDGTDNDSADNKHPEISDEHPKSCLSRRSSSKASIKKKVNYNDDAEVIELPPNDNLVTSIDDDVFSDSVPAQVPRGDMCTPYPKKQGSLPGIMALPDWFLDERCLHCRPSVLSVFTYQLFVLFS